MGKGCTRTKRIVRVVLDTNVIVSALLFDGELTRVVDLWETGRIAPLLSKETFDELRRVLEYPKFALNQQEIETIIHREILPFFEVVEVTKPIQGVCRDPEDDKFVSCLVEGRADFLVSGDHDLLGLKEGTGIKVISPRELIRMVG